MATDTILPAPANQSRDRLSEGLLFAQIVGSTVLQKIAVPMGDNELFLGFVILMLSMGAGILTLRLRVVPAAFIAYMAMAAVLCTTQLLGDRSFSIASLMLVLVVHLPYVFSLRQGATRPKIALLFYQKVMVVMAIVGVIQYGAQFVIGGWAFPMENHFPVSLIAPGFHGLNPVHYQSTIYKSNGVFFLEPAVFSQFLAIAVVIEMIYFRNIRRMAAYLAGIAVTFSGTGLIILFALTPLYLIVQRRFLILLLLGLAIATAGLWAPLVGLEATYNRAFEFTDTTTSGFARFISIFLILKGFILDTAQKTLFGMGAGTFRQYALPTALGFSAFDPSWGKVAFEYGFVGLAGYAVLMGTLFIRSPRSGYLRMALLIMFLLLGEYVLPPTMHGIILALLVWPVINAGESTAALAAARAAKPETTEEEDAIA